MKCDLCEVFYKTHPLVRDEETGEWEHNLDGYSSDPIRCAFEKDGVFNTDNWCCETMRKLRDQVRDTAIWSMDHNIGIITINEDDLGGGEFWSHLVLHWYKTRGRTDQAILFGGESRPLTLKVAKLIIENLEIINLSKFRKHEN